MHNNREKRAFVCLNYRMDRRIQNRVSCSDFLPVFFPACDPLLMK